MTIRPGTVVSAVVSLLLVFAGVWLVTAPRFGGEGVEPRHPSQIDIDVSDDARDGFIKLVETFGASNGFKLQIRPTDREGRYFYIRMIRADVGIVVSNPFEEGRQFTILFWQADDEPATNERADAVAANLRAALGGLQGVAPHVVKPRIDHDWS
jgi:hypothetical protein